MGKKDRKRRKQKERQERLRREKHLRHYGPGGPDILEDDEYLGDGPEDHELDLPSAIALERALRYRPSLLGRLFGWLPGRRRPVAEQSQELAYDAMEAMEEADPDRAVDLAHQSLALDPECSDALYVLALNDAGSRLEQVKLQTGSHLGFAGGSGKLRLLAGRGPLSDLGGGCLRGTRSAADRESKGSPWRPRQL